MSRFLRQSYLSLCISERLRQNCLLFLLITMLGAGCVAPNAKPEEDSEFNVSAAIAGSVTARKTPSENWRQQKTMLFIGQDLDSVEGYLKSGKFPPPAGVTTYLAFYNLLSKAHPAYGALGQDAQGRETGQDVDWGAGPLNASNLARKYPNAALNIGLNIAEGNQSESWAPGGLAAIAARRYDRHIRRLGAFFKSLEQTVYLRIGYEFDGVWNSGYEVSADYISAYRRIVDVLRSQQVSNVVYVWQASASPIDDILEGKRENITDWYPGDSYVDWMGLSWFLPPGAKRAGSVTQRQLADEVLSFARAKQKPVMIAEAAPQGYDLSTLTTANISPVWDGFAGENQRKGTAKQTWQRWYAPLFSYIRRNGDVVKALAYINADWDAQQLWSAPYANGYWGDSRIEVNPEIGRRWLSEISDRSLWVLR